MTISNLRRYTTALRLDVAANSTLPAATARLRKLGWTFAVSDEVKPASAVTNVFTKQIVCCSRIVQGGRRDRLYVLPHEKGHALDFAAGTPSWYLAEVLKLQQPSAQEALGEAVALWGARDTGEGKLWVLASITWHSVNPRWAYKWSHVRHPATKEMADLLVRGEGSGQFWQWSGVRLVAKS